MTDEHAKSAAPDDARSSRERDHEDAWLAEVERRWHAVESGLEATVDHEEALAVIFSPRLVLTRPAPAR
ncbi:hypothetical protein [Nannocystis pusilla]|uniref:hypothetical protein n=1 Tax=Nannocystis pusilla TaxID=889268 RepID=UPI003DA38420